jgi:hypothetical protein
MFGRKIRLLAILAAILLITGTFLVYSEGQRSKPSAKLKAEIEGPLVVDFPLIFKLTVTNTGEVPFYYWCGGPGSYPNAGPFVVIATDRWGQTKKLGLHNGQCVTGSGRGIAIKTTQELPAACDPLPAGEYSLRLTAKAHFRYDNGKRIEVRPALTSDPFSVTIVDDRAALELANERLRDREQADPFARHVAEVYGIDPIVKASLEQLLDGDPKFAHGASLHLGGVRRLPSGGGELLKRAVSKLCHADKGTFDFNLLRNISFDCRGIQYKDAVDAMVIIAKSAPDLMDVRRMAVMDIGLNDCPEADHALLDIAADKDSPLYWDALFQLGRRHNPAALKPLLEAASDPQSDRRSFALDGLVEFRDRPEVRHAIEAALHAKDPAVRESANMTLDWKQPDFEFVGAW